MTAPAPPDAPAANNKSAEPLITPLAVMSLLDVAPITVFMGVLFVIVASLDKLVPVAVPTIAATVPDPEPPAEVILIGTEIEALEVAIFNL